MSEQQMNGTSVPGDWKTNETNVLLMMTLAHTCAAMGMFLLAALGPVLEREMDMHAAAIGLLMGIAWLFGSVASTLSGGVIVRFGAATVLQLGLLAIAFGTLAFSMSGGFLLLALGMAVIGGGYGTVGPSSSVILSQFCRPERRSFSFSIKQTATPAGTAIAGIMVPYVTSVASWPWTSIMVAVISAVLAVAVFGFRTQWNTTPAVSASGFSSFGSLRLIFTTPRLCRLAIMCLLFACAQVGTTSYLALSVAGLADFSPEAAGKVLAFSAAAALFGRFIIGYLADRVRVTEHVLIGLGLAAAGAICLLALTSPDWSPASIYLLAIAFGISAHSWVGLYQAALLAAGPPSRGSELVSGSFVFMFLGGVSGPLLGGGMFALTHSYRMTLLLFGGMALIGTLTVALGMSPNSAE